jgi:hypothetical protein
MLQQAQILQILRNFWHTWSLHQERYELNVTVDSDFETLVIEEK